MDFRRKFLEIFETDNEHYLLKKVPFLLSMRMLLIASIISGIIFVTSNEEHLGGMLFLFLLYAFFLIRLIPSRIGSMTTSTRGSSAILELNASNPSVCASEDMGSV